MKIKHCRVAGMLVLVVCAGFVGGCVSGDETQTGDAVEDQNKQPDTKDTFDSPGDLCRHKLYFVRIDDHSESRESNPGADIDAVSITKATSRERFYATRVEEYVPVNESNILETSKNFDNILGEPSAFGTPFQPENAGPDKACSLDKENFVSLGGEGGYIIISFGDVHIEKGDEITVYEIGNCRGEEVLEPVAVQVSMSDSSIEGWITVFSATNSPVMSGKVKNRPLQCSDMAE